MSGWTRAWTGRGLLAALKAAGLVSAVGAMVLVAAGSAAADPDPAPGDPGVVAAPPAPPAPPPWMPPPPADPFAPAPGALPVATGPAAGQDPTPFTGVAPFGPPRFVPANGSTVGVAQPIIINFPGTVEDAGAAINAVHVSSVPPVSGKFYWMTPTQLRWRPLSFWPAHTAVTVDAGGTVSSFQTGDTLIATADDSTHQLTITRNGVVEKTFPMSMGMTAGGHQTPNGTYYVQDKKASVVMDSSTYGVPVNSTYGYKVTVEDAVRFDNVGDYVHSAPWSVDDQGKRDVSHGCINISPTNAKWFFDNFGPGDPIVVKNSTGGDYKKNDGSADWMN
ncbi:L,D-transpeptidase [Mycobacterium bohemicum]|nr:L,D-transpeptidase [Mycobacterium bohemicum]MCV6971529.1 L,D-transpeptidase [Mycobacterium bohemicum]